MQQISIKTSDCTGLIQGFNMSGCALNKLNCNRLLSTTTDCGGLIQDDNYKIFLIGRYIYTLL